MTSYVIIDGNKVYSGDPLHPDSRLNGNLESWIAALESAAQGGSAYAQSMLEQINPISVTWTNYPNFVQNVVQARIDAGHPDPWNEEGLSYWNPNGEPTDPMTVGDILGEPKYAPPVYHEVTFGTEFESGWIPYVVLKQEFKEQILYLFDVLGLDWKQTVYNAVDNLMKLEFSISPAWNQEGNWVGNGIDFEEFLASGILVTLTFEDGTRMVLSGVEFLEMVYGSQWWEIVFVNNLSKKPQDYRDGAYVVSSRPRTYTVRC